MTKLVLMMALLGASLTSDRFGNSNSAYEFNGTSDFISLEEPFFLTEVAASQTLHIPPGYM